MKGRVFVHCIAGASRSVTIVMMYAHYPLTHPLTHSPSPFSHTHHLTHTQHLTHPLTHPLTQHLTHPLTHTLSHNISHNISHTLSHTPSYTPSHTHNISHASILSRPLILYPPPPIPYPITPSSPSHPSPFSPFHPITPLSPFSPFHPPPPTPTPSPLSLPLVGTSCCSTKSTCGTSTNTLRPVARRSPSTMDSNCKWRSWKSSSLERHRSLRISVVLIGRYGRPVLNLTYFVFTFFRFFVIFHIPSYSPHSHITPSSYSPLPHITPFSYHLFIISPLYHITPFSLHLNLSYHPSLMLPPPPPPLLCH